MELPSASTLLLSVLLVLPVPYYLILLTTSYLTARRLNLPIFITPVNPQNALWTIFSVPLRPLLKALLPNSLFMRLELTTYGFEHRLKTEPLRIAGGDTYCLVGPGKVEVYTADKEVVKDVMADKGVGLSEMSISKFTERGWILWRL